MADENCMLSFSLKKNIHTHFLPGNCSRKISERTQKTGKGATSSRGESDD